MKLGHLLFAVSALVARIAVGYIAASTVLVMVGGIVGWLLAWCAAYGALKAYDGAWLLIGDGLDYIARRMEFSVVRSTRFYVIHN
jgi:hypothetical protein